MFDSLSVTLQLDADECIRGESVPFKVVVQNATKEVIRDLIPFEPQLRAVKLTAKASKSKLQADAYSVEFRDGVYLHHPDDHGMSMTLRAGQKSVLTGDLLPWFGELPPGNYEITAEYMSEVFASEPVPLKVLPAGPVSSSMPRYSTNAAMSFQSAVWCHKKKKKGFALMYQLQSTAMPRNPRVGLKVADLDVPCEPIVAGVPYPNIKKGHVIWQDDKGKVFVCVADTENMKCAAKWELPLPFAGSPLSSPLSMPDGGLFMPYADESREKMVLLTIGSGGDTDFHELDLGKTKPIGAYVCFWEYALRLHFAWAAPDGRQVFYARLPLDDPGSGFLSESAYISDDPVVWIEAYRDLEEPLGQMAYTEEQRIPEMEGVEAPPPPIYLWCVTRKGKGLTCLKVRLPGGTAQTVCTFTVPGAEDLRVVSSVVSEQYHLHMLVADSKDRLYYASTAQRTIVPIANAAGTEVGLDQCPSLLTPGMIGKVPWVHLRYIKDGKSIAYVRLEPEDRDPVERAQTAKAGRR